MTGRRPLLFDRYPGDNDSKLEPIEKVYWDRQGFLSIPVINIYSALTAENSKSAVKMHGKKAKTVAAAVNSYLVIEGGEYILITRDGDKIHKDRFGELFTIVNHVARLSKGIPNPKERPMLDTPWKIQFDIEFEPTPECSWTTLIKLFEQMGTNGLGTFRPMYGSSDVNIS